MDKDFYNKSSATQLGWRPSWFGEKYFDDKLVRAIKKWQKSNGLAADGLCGPSTFRRVWTERQAEIDEHKPNNVHYSNHLVYNGNFIPVEWDKVILWSEDSGLEAKAGNYYDYSGRADRNISLFVNHWDVCLNSHSCDDILDRRGASVHFLIDNDGTIYQTLDIQHGAWHAGNVNRKSVGVEISNAYYPKYQDWYERSGYGPRPLVEGAVVHGSKLEPFMDFYPIQIEALKALWAAIHKATGIPYKTLTGSDGFTSKKYEPGAAYGNFSGFISHYHVSKNKIDCANLDIKKLLTEI